MDRKHLMQTETTTGSFATDLFKPTTRPPRKVRFSLRNRIVTYFYTKIVGKRSVHTWSGRRIDKSPFLLLGHIDPDLIGFQVVIYHDFRGGCIPVATSRFWTYGEALRWVLQTGTYHKTTFASCRPVAVEVDANYRQKFAKFLARFF